MTYLDEWAEDIKRNEYKCVCCKSIQIKDAFGFCDSCRGKIKEENKYRQNNENLINEYSHLKTSQRIFRLHIRNNIRKFIRKRCWRMDKYLFDNNQVMRIAVIYLYEINESGKINKKIAFQWFINISDLLIMQRIFYNYYQRREYEK